MQIGNRDLLFVGVKLIGLWILCHGILAFGQNVMDAQTARYNFLEGGTTVQWTSTEGLSAEFVRDMTEKWKIENQREKVLYKIQMVRSYASLPWHFLTVLLGLYMCRRGELLVTFLGGKEMKDSQPPPPN